MADSNATATRPTTALPGPAWLANFERSNGAPPDNGNLTGALQVYFESMETTLALIMVKSDDGSADDQRLARILYHQTEDMRAYFERWQEANAWAIEAHELAGPSRPIHEEVNACRAELSADPDNALTGLLTDAYRANRQLQTMLVAMYWHVDDLAHGRWPVGRRVDLGWTAEIAADTAERGVKALVHAGHLLGVDECALASFRTPEDVQGAAEAA